MATPMETWQDELLPRVPGADPTVVERELQGTLREFYRTSGSWVEELPAMNVKDGKAEYDFNPVSDNKQVLYTLRVIYNGRDLGLYDKRPAQTLTSTSPIGALLTAPGRVQLIPTPSEDITDGLSITATLTFIKRACHQPPDYVVTQWYDVVLDGATGRLMQHIKRPYSNPKMATFYLKRFRNGMREARDATRRAWGFAESSFSFPATWTRTTPFRSGMRF